MNQKEKLNEITRKIRKIKPSRTIFCHKLDQDSVEEALKLFEAMWQEGMDLGVLPPKDPMEGIEVDIRIARILNACSKSS